MPFTEAIADEGQSDLDEPVQNLIRSIEGHEHGQRLDRVLSSWIGGFSRSYLQQLIAEGAVQLNGCVWKKPSAKVLAGQEVTIELRPTEQSMAFVAESMPLTIIFSDAHLLVVNKPAGLVVHPAAGNWSGTLLNGLLALDPVHGNLPRAGIVHRLDKDTSGLMIVARSRQAMDGLVSMIAARQVSRTYIALAEHHWNHSPVLSSHRPLGRDPRNRLRMSVVDLQRTPGKPATTHFELLASSKINGGYCLVKAKLETGRTHQIRVHMADLGHSLVGDSLYGGQPAMGLHRQALHAICLELKHPISGVLLSFHCPPPDDISHALDFMGWATIVQDFERAGSGNH